MTEAEKIQLATTVTVTSNYEGSVAGNIIGASFKEADTIARNLVTFLPNVTYKASIRLIDYGNGRVDYTCGFTPEGSIVLSEKELIPKKIKNQSELCKEDLRPTWSDPSMGASSHNDMMPADIENAILTEILADTAQATDMQIWQGNSATNGAFGGFIPLFIADGSVIKPTGVGAPVDKSNVVSGIETVVTNIPVELRRKPDLIFAISPDVADFYMQSLVNPQITNGLGGGNLQLQYGRYTMEVINGLPDNTIVVYRRANLFFGTGLLADHNEVKISDTSEILLDGQVRYSMVYNAGVQYANSEDIVYFNYTTS